MSVIITKHLYVLVAHFDFISFFLYCNYYYLVFFYDGVIFYFFEVFYGDLTSFHKDNLHRE